MGAEGRTYATESELAGRNRVGNVTGRSKDCVNLRTAPGQAVYRYGRPRHIELVTTGLRYSSIPYAASMGSPSCGIRKTRPSPSTKNVRLEKPSDVERSAVILRPSAK
jgi:hypothetical protein